MVNKSDLLLVNASVMQPKPDSVILTLQSALDLKIALPVRIEPITLNLYVSGLEPQNYWGDITIPAQTIRGNTTLGVSNHYEPLHNLSTWNQFVHNVVFEKESGLSVHGATNSFLGVLKSHVVMAKTIRSPGGFYCAFIPTRILTVVQRSTSSRGSASPTVHCC